MTKKKIFALALCLIYILSTAVFAAAEGLTVQVVDGVAGTLKISGTAPAGAGKNVTLVVTNDEGTLEDVVMDMETYLQYQDTVVTDDGGYFEKTFDLYLPGVENAITFNFYAGGAGFEGAEIATTSLWYAPVSVKLSAAKSIVEEADASVAGASIENYKAVFAVESEIFASLDKTGIATLLKSKVAEDLFAGYEEGKEEEYLDEYVEFENALKLSIALEAYNQDKKALVITEIGFANDDIIGLADYIAENGTLDDLYTSDIKDAATENVTNALFGKNVTEKEDLQKLFAREIIVQALKNNKKNGNGIIAGILTEENLAAAGCDVVTDSSDSLKGTYFAIEDTTAVNNDIYQNRKNINAGNLEAEIIKSAKKDYAPEDPSTSGGVAGPSTGGNQGGLSVGLGGGSKPVQPDPAPADPQNSKKSFNDLTGYDWAKVAIETLAEKGILNGVADDKFDPAGTLTREAAAKIICLAAGITPANEGVAFGDVAAEAWYTPYIAALSKAGIINGISDTQFGIGNNVTREDFAVMICRALNYSSTSDNSFTDKDAISGYALDAVSALYEKGIVGGYEDGSFKPKANISRAEGAKIIFGILSK